jgi:hypothetical protein
VPCGPPGAGIISLVIDRDGQVTLIRSDPEDVWHIVELDDGSHLVAACGVMLAKTRAERRTVPVDRLLQSGRICLVCAQALLSLA